MTPKNSSLAETLLMWDPSLHVQKSNGGLVPSSGVENLKVIVD